MNECLFNLSVLILRVGFGFTMLVHGMEKLKLILNGEAEKWLDPIGIGAVNSLRIATFTELWCSVLVILGVFTRTASVLLSFTMFVAAFWFLRNATWPEKELAVIYMLGFIVLAILGGGKYSFANLFFGSKSLLVNF